MGRRTWAGIAVVALCASAAAVGAGVGSARTAAPAVSNQASQCPFTRNPVPGWQASFGRTSVESSANAIQARAMQLGFQNLIVQRYCAGGFEVVLRGICPMGVAYDLQQEARRVNLEVTLDYKKPADRSPDLVAVFGHFRTRAAAEAFVPRVERQFSHVSIIQDGGCNNDWEVAVTGITSPSQGAAFAAQARPLGFNVTIEAN